MDLSHGREMLEHKHHAECRNEFSPSEPTMQSTQRLISSPSRPLGPIVCSLALSLVATQALGAEADRIRLTELSAYRLPIGDWTAVRAVSLNPQDTTRLTALPGTGVLMNGTAGRTVDLITREEFSDVEVHLEFCISEKSNSGVYLMGRYEVQIYDSYGVAKDQYPGIECGGIYPRWAEDRGEFEGHSPRVNASQRGGEWQSFDITFRGPRFDDQGNKVANAQFVRVLHNGQTVHENVEVTGPTRAAHWNDESSVGPLLIQGDHGPVAIRNLTIRRLPAAAPEASHAVSTREFFVAPQGDDTHPGTRSLPFRSFQRAQAAVRAERRTHPDQGVIVTALPGRYELLEPLGFTAADSGASALHPVVYRAQPGGEVILSGGRLITGWQPDPDHPGLWRTRVTDSGATDDATWKFEQLWVNDQRAIRARTPNWWEFGTLAGVSETPVGGDNDRMEHSFITHPRALRSLANLPQGDLQDVQAVVLHKWDTTRERLQTAHPETGRFVTQGSRMKSWNPMTRDCLFYLENYRAALDAPGEWFLDRSGWLVYHPRPNEDMTTAETIAPRIDRFLEIAGQAEDPAAWVQHLYFEGLKFRHSEWRIPPEGLPPAQAVMNVKAAAIQVDAAEDIRFRHCAVEHIGSTAFWFRHAARNCSVDHTRLFDLGISGIRIGEPEMVPEPVRTGGITVHNCIVQSGGRLAPPAVGVWIGHSADNVISHCDIGDFFYTAISVGWRWGYAESAAKRNRIEFNHLHHLGYSILSDMGGVYTLGPSEGTRIANNHIHDVHSTHYGGWGLYPDEGSTGIVFENNLVHDVHDGCVHQHYGKENIFRNNILAFSEQGQIAVTRAEPHLSFTFERNIVYWDDGFLLGYGGWSRGANVTLRSNLYWRAQGRPFDFDGKSFEAWTAQGRDEGSIIADPLMVDPANRDFRLRPGSPASRIGFQPFDVAQAGVTGDPAWRQLARSVTFPKPYVVPPSDPADNGNAPTTDTK